MKTKFALSQKHTFKAFSFIGILVMTLLTSHYTYGQTKTVTSAEITSNDRTIKGLISNEDGPLDGVNIVLKDTANGTITNAKGEFTFPVKLKTGDVLVISYLGYENQNVRIKENVSFIELVLTEDLVEMIGALDAAKPYKSKRKN